MHRFTWVLLGVLAAVGLIWFLLHRGTIALPAGLSGTATATTEVSQFLFAPEQGTINGIRIQDSQGHSVHVRRGAGGTWSMLEPQMTSADPALTEGAATQAAALKILASLDPAVDLSVVGLDKPAYTLTLETSQGDLVFNIGNSTVTDTGYYVRTPQGNTVVVTKFSMDALTGLLTSPPYAQTPTPSMGPAATLVATRNPTATP